MLFPANTVMNLLQDLVTREPRLAAKLSTNHHPVAPTSCTAGELPEMLLCAAHLLILPQICYLACHGSRQLANIIIVVLTIVSCSWGVTCMHPAYRLQQFPYLLVIVSRVVQLALMLPFVEDLILQIWFDSQVAPSTPALY